MRVHRIATATMLALAVSGWGVVGPGAAYAETGPTHGGKAKATDKGHPPAHGKAKARAEGGSSTGGEVFQQNIAQSARQNSNCNNPNPGLQGFSLTGSRVTGRCVTTDGSHTAFSRMHNGLAVSQGGTSAATLAQQNIAQRGRQNNNCHNPNGSFLTVNGGRVEGHCTDRDLSFSKHTFIKGGGARAEGGSSDADLFQQNIAQEGRQNNNCHNRNLSDTTVTGGGVERSSCGNKDASFSKHTQIKGGGARAEGGSSTGGGVVIPEQQNTAQEGRQNNNCDNPNQTILDVTGGGVERSRCGNKDASFSKHTQIKGGGARAEGGYSTGGVLFQQNFAQEGRQNNNCNPNFVTFTVTGGRLDSSCRNKDHSYSKKVLMKSRGAHVEGGSSAAELSQQNIAQEGRQNNNCDSSNNSLITVTGGRLDSSCRNKDHSFNKKVLIKSRGAHVESGSNTGGDVFQQSIAQEGRQNNNCAALNNSEITVMGDRAERRCKSTDESKNLGTKKIGGGAHVESGSTTDVSMSQQNIAQEGRQNNACANPNFTRITVNDSRSSVGCKTLDHSTNLGTTEISSGAKTQGGSNTALLFQQNIAQEGRQNNNCANPNNLTLTTTSNRTQTQCTAIDRSINIHTINR
ncbi:hypothetical protein [Streptomyces sp. NPDC051776]|uniref:hypothetical protein n=1 Tax=Streptomyces sp. NPDC051776 TaxID=3155414 RepID=UPI00344A2EE9